MIFALEFVGTLFALLGVWLTTRQNIWCWLVAMGAVVIYAFVFFQSQLYGDSILQLIYLALSLYGWYEWRFGGKNNTELAMTRLNLNIFFASSVVGIACTLLFGYLLKMTDSDVPWLDAGTTAFSLVATWMMAKKIMENWLYWLLIDSIYVGIYLYKGLNVTSFQYCIFTFLAAYGYWKWNNQWHTQIRKVKAS